MNTFTDKLTADINSANFYVTIELDNINDDFHFYFPLEVKIEVDVKFSPDFEFECSDLEYEGISLLFNDKQYIDLSESDDIYQKINESDSIRSYIFESAYAEIVNEVAESIEAAEDAEGEHEYQQWKLSRTEA